MKWTKEKCQEEALKYKSRGDYQKNSKSSYIKAVKEKWLDEICSHMIQLIKPKNYWTKEKCQEEALKYDSRIEYQNNSASSYEKALKMKWIDDICSHMKQLINCSNYWTKDRCREAALKCLGRKEFCKKYKGAYESARLNNFLDEICSHMITTIKPRGYWTKDRCRKAAILCRDKKEFRNNYVSAYIVSYENKWLDEICSHMIEYHKPNGYWDKNKCAELASGCTYRNEFQQKYKVAYNKSLENNWLDEICSHMEACGNLNERLIYAFLFPNDYIYIGLTCNIARRKNEHLSEQKRNTSVYKYILESGLIPELIKISDYIEVDKAIKLEKYYIEIYSNNGYKLLNKNKGGTIGYSKNINNWDYKTHKRKKSNV
jgi:predicted GIY-YIG superfamily endonuclease